MRLSQIKETASAGATGAGAICTNLAGGTPPKGQFFGGDPASSIYPTIKKHRKARKEETVEEAVKTAKQPKKPSGKAEVIGTTKPYKQPNVLSPTMKVKSTGKMLGGSEKKNPTLSTKFFGTCSATNDPGNKSIIAELSYNEFRNASNAITKMCPTCSSPFKNIHDAKQKFCSKECEGPGQVAEKLKEAFDRMWEQFETKDGKIIDVKTVRDLVKRVMDDSGGQMGRLQACLFVAGMLKNCTGWTVHFALEDLAKKEAAEMYKPVSESIHSIKVFVGKNLTREEAISAFDEKNTKTQMDQKIIAGSNTIPKQESQ